MVIGGSGDHDIVLPTGDTAGDVVCAGSGNDNTDASDTDVDDFVDCGPGDDTVRFDEGLDEVVNPETASPES